MLNASSDVTAALRRTHNLMQAELSRSQFAQETLGQYTWKSTLRSYADSVYQNNQLQLSPLSRNRTTALTVSSPRPATSPTLFFARKNPTPGTLRLHSTFWSVQSLGLYFAAFFTVHSGG